jgi:hypothetical protein
MASTESMRPALTADPIRGLTEHGCFMRQPLGKLWLCDTQLMRITLGYGGIMRVKQQTLSAQSGFERC